LYANEPEFILARFAGVSELEYSFFDTTLYLSYLIFGLLIGLVSDRLAKRKVFLGLGGFGSSFFYWLMTIAAEYHLLLLLRFVQGAFTVFAWQTLMTLVLDHSSSHNRGKHMGIFGAFMASAMGAGPMIGGLLDEQNVFFPYYGASVLSLSVAVVAGIAVTEPTRLVPRPSLVQSLLLARRSPGLMIPATVNFVDRLHMGFILTALPLMLVQILGVSESLRGVTLALFALPFILLQYPMGRLSDRVGRRRLIIFGSVSYALTLAFVGLAGQISLAALIITLVILGVFSGVTGPPNMAWVGDHVPSADSATGMALFNLLGNGGMMLGPVVLGIALALGDFLTAFFLASFIELISILIVIAGGRVISIFDVDSTSRELN
ncbi:MFS transporter, partial [Candidatus Thorarchaeota archaeon]